MILTQIPVLLYFIVLIIVSARLSRSVKKLADFVLAGRAMNGYMVGLSAGAADMSGWLLLTLPGVIFVGGVTGVWLPIALVLGAWANWVLIAKRLRVYTDLLGNALTIPSYLQRRFGFDDNNITIITGITIIIFFTAYAGASLVMFAIVCQSIFPNLEYYYAIALGALLSALYSSFGGFVVINRLDFIQAVIIFMALIALALFLLNGYNQPPMHTTDWLAFSKGIDLSDIIQLLAWGVGYFGQLQILNRFMSIKHPNDMQLAASINLIWMFLALAAAVTCGLLGKQYYDYLINPESVIILLALDTLHPFLAGFVLAAILSAIMSSITAQVLSASTSLTADIYHKLVNLKASNKKLILVSRITVGIIVLLSAIFASWSADSIFNMVRFAWSGLGASFGPVLLASLYWINMSRAGLIAGMISGGLMVLLWKLLNNFHWIFSINEIIPGFIISSLLIIIFSKIFPDDNHIVKQDFHKMLQTIKNREL